MNISRLLVIAWLLALAGCAGSPEVMTPSCDEWRLTGAHSFEQQSPGMGVSRRYQCGSAWADVYFYDLRRTDWRPGVSDPQLAAHFDSTVREVLSVWGAGGRGVEVSETRDITVAGAIFRMVQFRYSAEGRPLVSRTYLTGRNGSLLKYRVTMPESLADSIGAVAEQLIARTVDGPHPGAFAAGPAPRLEV